MDQQLTCTKRAAHSVLLAMDASSKEQADEPGLLEALDTAWGLALFSALDPAARLAVFRTSTQCRLFAIQASEQFSVSLLAYGSLSQADWWSRQARAEGALAVRGQGRSTALILRLPTPSPTALAGITGLSTVWQAGPSQSCFSSWRTLESQVRTGSTQGSSTACPQRCRTSVL